MRKTKYVIYFSCFLSVLSVLSSAKARVNDHSPVALSDTHMVKNETRGISPAEKRPMQKLQLLDEAMKIEDKHSLGDKLDDYNWNLIKGLVATILGGAAIPTSSLLFFGWFVNQDCQASEELSGFVCNEDAGKIYGAIAKSALSRGVVLLSVGIPTLLSRNKAGDRRYIPKLKDEPPKTTFVKEWNLSLNIDLENQVGLVTLDLAF